MQQKPSNYLNALRTFAFVSTVFVNFSVTAQEFADNRSTGGWRSTLPPESERQWSPAPPGKVLPSFVPPSKEEDQEFPSLRVFVEKIKITGNTIFTDEALAEITAPYTNREITSEDLEQLRLDLTTYYVDSGYVTSGAYIPDQITQDGSIEFRIIEGRLDRVEVKGNRWFRSRYVKDKFYLAAGPPVNINILQRRIQLLEQHPGIERLNVELRPGLHLGQSHLNVAVTENLPYKVALEFNNFQSPTVGAERGILTLSHQNVFGFGDALTASAGISEGVKEQMDFSYSLPFNVHDTTLSLEYGKDDFSVVEDPFDPLDIESETESLIVRLSHPVYRTLNDELTLAFTGQRIQNQTFALDGGFKFSPGASNVGKSVVSALRFSQEWIRRTQDQVLAVNSRFTLGVDVFGATNNSSGVADSQFLAWIGQFQWVRREARSGVQVVLRSDVQLANDPLLPVEQIVVGGRDTVRGYRQNQLVRDNVVITSVETRFPVIRNKPWADVVELIPFFDWGRGWNREVSTPEPKTIASMGIGFHWKMTLPFRYPVQPDFEVFWGHTMKDVETVGGDLQDDGIHIRFRIRNI